MHRFFCAQICLDEKTVTISDPQEIRHLKTVLHLKPHQQIQIFDDKGHEAVGTILSIKHDQVEVRKDYVLPQKILRKTKIVLSCAIPKKAKFEFIIEKCTELGVDEIIPLITQRTIVSLSPDQVGKKFLRYQTVILNAVKQSGRANIPSLQPVGRFGEVIQSFEKRKNFNGFIPSLCEKTGKRQNLAEVLSALRCPKEVSFFIGPEGDFTGEEMELAVKAGLVPVSLGSTVLKVDTAAITVVALANLFFNHG